MSFEVSTKYPAATIPPFDHSTINYILEANRNIIKILTKLQNSGCNDTEQRIYMKKLQTNLTFLGILADACQLQAPHSKLNTNVNQNYEIPDPTKSRTAIMQELTPPVMLSVPDSNIPDSGLVFQIPPFVGKVPEKEFPFYNIVEEKIARELVNKRNFTGH